MRRWIPKLNPIAALLAPLPAMLIVVFSRDFFTPIAFAVWALSVLALSGRWRTRAWLALVAGSILALIVLGVTIGVWLDPSRISTPGAEIVLLSIGDWSFTLAGYLAGVMTAARLLALFLLALTAGLFGDGARLVRALVQVLGVPYRIGYTTLAAFRFVPRFRDEYQQIRVARRLRGVHSHWWQVVPRTVGYAVPLLAGALRHAERVALAMESRGFGALSERTERYREDWNGRDNAWLALNWIVAAGVLLAAVLTR